jgi:hypothetical protein
LFTEISKPISGFQYTTTWVDPVKPMFQRNGRKRRGWRRRGRKRKRKRKVM